MLHRLAFLLGHAVGSQAPHLWLCRQELNSLSYPAAGNRYTVDVFSLFSTFVESTNHSQSMGSGSINVSGREVGQQTVWVPQLAW